MKNNRKNRKLIDIRIRNAYRDLEFTSDKPPLMSIGAQMKLAELKFMKEKGMIKDFRDFKEVEYGKTCTFKITRLTPIKRIESKYSVGFNFG